MEAIDYSWLNKNTAALAGSWNDEYKPFKYIVIDDFLKPAVAESIYSEYPNVTSGEWS